MTCTVTEALIARARATPDAVAYTANGDAITYGALSADARQLARALARCGVGRGDRCAIVLPTGLDLIRLVYATQLLGAAPVVVNPDLPGPAIVRRLHLVRAGVAIVASPGVAAAVAATTTEEAGRQTVPCPVVTVDDIAKSTGAAPLLIEPAPDETAFLQLTSGTTGEPRAVVISHRSLVSSLIATAARLDLRASDVLATWVPLHHDLGLVRYVFGVMLTGCVAHLIRPSMGNLRPWLLLVARTRATITGAPDSAYRLAARTVDPAGLDLGALRFAGNGGEPVRRATIDAFEQRFGVEDVVRPAYGLAEATLTVTSAAPGEPLRVDERGTVSCGRPIDGIDLRIAAADGSALPPGATGEILVRGPAVFDGYFDDDVATRQAVRDGWLHTGDVGSVDGHGYLFVTARARALIKRGGVAIAPREVEDAVNAVSGVAGSAAVGVVLRSLSETEDVVIVAELSAIASDDRHAERVHQGIEAEVRRAVGIAPGRVLLVPAGTLPRTAAGKVQYDELRRMVMTGRLDYARGAASR